MSKKTKQTKKKGRTIRPGWKKPREVQLAYAARGKCEQCGKRKPISATLCAPCLRKHNAATSALQNAYLDRGLCKQCGRGPLASKLLCAPCLRKHNDRTRAARAVSLKA